MIFSHGYTDHANYVSGAAREFASHGIMVFTLDHHDGSCPFTQKQDGTNITFNCSQSFGTQSMMDEMIDIRVDDVKKFTEDILTDGFL